MEDNVENIYMILGQTKISETGYKITTHNGIG